MNGLDNKNISQTELYAFAEKVVHNKAVCPVCGKHVLKMKDFYDGTKFDPETYIVGWKPFVYFEVQCECGYEKEFSTLWCFFGEDGQYKTYKVGLAVGGVMEKPNYDHENVEEISARSEAEAIALYKEKHGTSYWSTTIVPGRW